MELTYRGIVASTLKPVKSKFVKRTLMWRGVEHITAPIKKYKKPVGCIYRGIKY